MDDGTDWGDLPKVEDVTDADAQAEVDRLAKLTRAEYESARKDAASRLGWRASVLDREVQMQRPPDHDRDDQDQAEIIETLEPWGEPVDGASLAEEVRDRLTAHVVFGTSGDADAATLWVFGTYLMDTWRLWPRLMITSPTKQCGKSTLLEVIDAMAHRGLIISNTKSAGVFRAIEAWRPTLLMDEADTWMKEDQELAGILNSGHTRRTARVIRVQEKAGELVPTLFSTWCPMVIAGIGAQRDTLTSRSIMISLRRKLPEEVVQRLPFDLHEQMTRTRRQLARWTADNAMSLGAKESEPPKCGNDRRQDNYTPLWRIAEALGGPWPDRIAAAYAASAQAEDEDEPASIMMLRDLMEIFDNYAGTKRLQSVDLVNALSEMEDRPWAEWRNGRPLTAQTIAKLMKGFEVKPRNAKMHGRVLKAYHRTDVEAAFTRYAPKPPENPLPRYHAENTQENPSSTRYPDSSGSGAKPVETVENQGGSGVADNSTHWADFSESDDPFSAEAWR